MSSLFIPDLNVKTVDFDIVKRGLTERIGRDVVNVQAEVEEVFDYLVIRLTQRMLAKQADETLLTGTETHTDKRTLKQFETVPANWWSHILVAIIGGLSVPVGYGWRWKILKHAKLKDIVVSTTNITHTTNTAVTKFTRVCPHVHIPDTYHHMLWMYHVNDEIHLWEEPK